MGYEWQLLPLPVRKVPSKRRLVRLPCLRRKKCLRVDERRRRPAVPRQIVEVDPDGLKLLRDEAFGLPEVGLFAPPFEEELNRPRNHATNGNTKEPDQRDRHTHSVRGNDCARLRAIR